MTISPARAFLLAPLLAFVAVLSGMASCGGDGAGTREPIFLSIGTAPPGGAFFVVGGALAQVLADQRGWQVTAEATKGSLESIRRLDGGELELALLNSAITYSAVRGLGSWKRNHRLRSLMTLADNVMAFITPEGSGISRMTDLKGKRVVVGVAGAGWEHFIEPLLTAHGIGYPEFTPLHHTQAGAVDMLADGSADAAFLGGAIPTASLVQATTSQKIRFLPFDERAMEDLVERYPFYFRAAIPAGTYPRQEGAIETLSFGSMHLVVREDMDEDLAYTITRTIYENRETVAQNHAAGKSIRADNVVRDTGTPFHPGAIRYYREIGIWP